MRRRWIESLATFLAVATISASHALASRGRPGDTLPATPDSVLLNPNVQWEISELPKELRDRAVLHASEAPHFPDDDSTLLNPNRWPEVRFFGSRSCTLAVVANGAPVNTPEDVSPGSAFCLSYDCGRRHPMVSSGPTYCWKDGSLQMRFWTAGDSGRYEEYRYVYYSTGELLSCERRTDGYDLRTSSRSPFERWEMVFAKNGTLIGCEYGSGPKNPVHHSFWLGRSVDHRSYQDEAVRAELTAHGALRRVKD